MNLADYGSCDFESTGWVGIRVKGELGPAITGPVTETNARDELCVCGFPRFSMVHRESLEDYSRRRDANIARREQTTDWVPTGSAEHYGDARTRKSSSAHHTLYRMFNVDGELLYIGISDSPMMRFHQHGVDKAWWYEVARIEIEHCDARDELEAMERLAIIRERPKYNHQHNSRVRRG